MPKLIVTSRYLKSGSGKKKQLYHYVKYIATREGSVPIPNANETAPATKSQQELISSLLHDFPDSKELFEYEDYQKNPTIKNGSALISVILDRNMDRLTSRENYVGYLANRPGTVKFGSHGLFSQSDEPINLEKVAKDIANHGGNVWTHVVSLRRDNAQAMGYDNLKAWRELVKRQISNIAKNQKIDMANLKWYAAFHDKKTNPHVHIIVYSTNEREGFLTNHGIEKIRSGFANDIYADELHHLYAQQTDLRNQMKKESEQLMKQLADNISQNDVDNAELIDLVAKLHEQLNSSKGKKVYGYLKADVKKTVDEIFIRLAENESIQKMYSLWCEMEQQKHDVYSSARVQFPKLADNKEFKSVKNMIIQTVLDMNSPVVDIEIEEPELTEKTDDDITDIPPQIDEFDNAIYFDNDDMAANGFSCSSKISPKEPDDSPKSKYYLKWSNAYKEACKLIYNKQSKLEDFQKAEQLLLNESGAGNVLAIHDLGKLYSTEKLGAKEEEKSSSFYKEALQGFMEIEPDSDYMFPYEPKFKGQVMKPADMRSYVWYRIGKMHCYGLGTEQDYEKAFQWFLKSSQEGHKFAQYSLANLYYYGNGVEKDLSQAFLWYQKSASQGQPYASYAAAQMYSKGEYVAENKETAQRYYKAALSGFLELESKDQADDNLFYKIGVMYKNGLGTEADISKAIDYFKRSAEMNNKNGLYEYGKALIQGNHIEADLEKGLECVEKAMKLKNSNAKRFFALEYISGEHFSQDIEKGLFMLTECADKGDSFACFQLGQFYLKGEIVTQDLERAEKYLLLAEDNEFTQYAFGKLYLQEEKYDIQKAVDYFEKSADKNMWSSYQLGRLYLFGADELEKDKEKAVEWLTKSANDGNEYVQNMLNNIDDFENMLLRNTVMGLFVNLSRCIEDNYSQKQCSLKIQTDRKLRKMIQKRKSGIGIREEQNMTN
ncbi:sel1 repeat family protein [Ruminococcus sp. AF37-20]|uniref:MobP3 family relaxase n=1 Tax=Ruminococcus sp. AF37-20 TaxID=2293178 RepID=UPI000E47E321|nr:MobP3 family relaxase [Ruminococcus sp. AF37-20]RGF43556.1 sel1 repeat family protein [Ruminococcus sp. AF37-20]